MPRIEIWLAPVADCRVKLSPGDSRTRSSKSLTPRSSICSALKVLTLMATLDKGSARRVAVTTISSIAGPCSVDFAAICACAGANAAGSNAAAPRIRQMRADPSRILEWCLNAFIPLLL